MARHRIRSWLSAATAVVATLFVCPAALAAQERPPRTVLTIHAGSQYFPANPVMDAAIRDVLMSRAGVPVDYYTEYIETDRFGPVASAALVDYVRRKYEGRHIDVVIAMTNYALQFVLEHRDELFPGVPIAFAGIVVPDEAVRRAGGGIAAVRVGSAYEETLKLALQLHPSTKRVFVMARSASQPNVDAVRAQLSVFSRQVQPTFVEGKTLSEVLAAIAAPPQTIASTCGSGGPKRRRARIGGASGEAWPRPRRFRCTAPWTSTSAPASSAAWSAARARRASRWQRWR